MKSNRSSYIILLGILVLIVVYFIITYNSLVKKDEVVKKQWNEIQSNYQRRLDLIPNIVNVVKGAADFEQTTLQKVTEARAKATSINVSTDSVSADSYKKQSLVQNELAKATNNMVISIEKYPSLKGTEAFAGLQAQLEGTERRIKFARTDFNAAIADYNNSARRLPSKIVAILTGFKPKEGFQADEGADKSVEIKF